MQQRLLLTSLIYFPQEYTMLSEKVDPFEIGTPLEQIH